MTDGGRVAAPSGLLLLSKQAGLTSFEALGAVKKALGTGKAGHTGTLDKFAEGLLLVLTGRALKLSPWFLHCDKQYEGTIRFGIESDTLDPEGKPVAEAALPSREAVEKILPLFSGEIMQAPPAYSAIHIDGKRASALARSGKQPEMKKRPVRVYRLELLLWDPPFARIFVHCSSGTYIRSLARDIALAAGSRACLHALTRTKVAGFSLEDAVGNEAFRPRPIDKAVLIALGLPWFEIEPQNVKSVAQGKSISHALAGKSPVFPPASPRETSPRMSAGIFSGDSFIAMIEKDKGGWKYGYVYADS
ncbi:MAG: tRNA pseudouridine(55) synthase TruB [Treponema sp.]|nr:tRNA pseudouridine(55) synthase TruB [Treponema sp.]